MSKKTKWSVGRVQCKSCGKQWVAVRRDDTNDNKLECPRCHRQNSRIMYGEEGDKNDN